MKNINYIILFALLGFTAIFSGCENDPDVSNISRVTYFPLFEFEGESVEVVPCSSSYVLPPIIAAENGVELPVTTVITGVFSGATTFDINNPDKYLFSSTAVNADGFPATLDRTVWVACTGDLVNSIEGLYKSTVVRNGVMSAQYTNMKYVMIRKVGPNLYELSDAIGGYYDIGRGYGDAYRASGIVITANNIPANDFSINGPVGVGAFGGEAVLSGLTVDPDAKTITFSTAWDAGYTFVVTLTQCPL